VAFFALGSLVRRHGEASALFSLERPLVDHGSLVAWWLTWSCYPYVIGPIAIVLLVLAWRFPAWRARIFFSLVMLLVCWQAADLLQHIFQRPRRLDWVVRHETAFSYPSSHAAIVTGFYLLWAVMLRSRELPAPVRAIGPALLGVLALAVLWARLALGAHYLTDLAGGVLLAIGLVFAGLSLVPINVLGRPPRGP
jgi:membrane-associated phospholipid phosphatase